MNWNQCVKRIIGIVAAVMVCCRSADAAGKNPERSVPLREQFAVAEKRYRRALKNIKKSKWEQAERIMEDIMRERSENLRSVTYALALTRFKQGKYGAARALLEKLTDPDAQYLLGRCLEEEGKHLKAITAYRAVREKSGRIPAEVLDYRIALNFLMSQNSFSAEDSFAGFLADYPESDVRPYARYHLGSALFQNRKYGIAEEYFNTLLAENISPEMNTRCSFMLGECKFYLTDYITAEQHYLDVVLSELHDNPWVPQAFYRRAWCAYKLRNVSDFMNLSGKFRKQFPAHTLLRPLLYLIGYSFAEDGQMEKAVKIFRHVLDLEPRDELWDAALKQTAACYTARGDMGSIVTVCQHLLQKSEHEKTWWKPGILLYLGEAYYRQGFMEQAQAVYRRILDEYPLYEETVEAKRGLAWCRYTQKDDDAAQQLYHELAFPRDTAAVPEDIRAESMCQIGNCLANKGKYQEAVALYESVVKNFPDNAYAEQALYYKGEALYQSEYYILAVKTWKRLSEEGKDRSLKKRAAVRAADTYFLLQDFAAAQKEYRHILEEYPGTPDREDITLRLAQSFYNAKDYRNAVDVYTLFISSFAGSPRRAEAGKGREMAAYMGAIETRDPRILAQFAENNPRGAFAADALLMIGQLHFDDKAYLQAIEAFQNVFTAYPDRESAVNAYYMLSRIYRIQGDAKLEEQTGKAFLNNFPGNEFAPEITFNVGLAQCAQDNYADAAGMFSAVLGFPDKNDFAAAAQYNLALCYKKLKQWENATEAYRVLSRRYPDFKNIRSARHDLGILLTEQGLYDEAYDLYALLLHSERGEGRQEVLYKLSEICMSMKKKSDALDMLERIFASAPANSTWRLAGMVKLGELYEADKNWDRAVEVYKEIAVKSGSSDIGRAAKSKLELLVKLKNNRR